MTEEIKNDKKRFFSRIWVKVTAGVIGGTVILTGTFATAAIAGAKADSRGFDRSFSTSAPDNRHQLGRMGAHSQGKGHAEGEARGFGTRFDREPLTEDQRLAKINQWLETLELEPLNQLPEQLSGSSEELAEKRRLEIVNKRLEALGIEPLDELPEGYLAK
jgi:hypothetical protein